MKFILLALILSSFCHANTIVLNSAEVPTNRISNALKVLLPAMALLQKEMLEISRDSILEKIEKFWEKMRGIYKNNNPEQEGPRGTGPSRGNSPAQPVLPPIVSGATSTDIQTINYDDGRVYRGHVRNGQPWGFGTMSYLDGTRHEGNWHDGLEDGRVTVFYPPHRLIESQTGLWRDGMQEQVLETRLREGVILMPQGYYWGPVNADNQPDTTTEDGSEEGPAILEYFSGHRYKGEFARGLRSKTGTIWYQDGSIYSGQWEYDQQHDRGILYYTSGFSIEAFWVRDQIDTQQPAIIHFPNGDVFEGHINQYWQPDGLGTLYMEQDQRVSAAWSNNDAGDGFGVLRPFGDEIYTGPTFGFRPDGLGILQRSNLLYTVEHDNGFLLEEILLLELAPRSRTGSLAVSRASSTSHSLDDSDSSINPYDVSRGSSFDFNSSAASSSSQ